MENAWNTWHILMMNITHVCVHYIYTQTRIFMYILYIFFRQHTATCLQKGDIIRYTNNQVYLHSKNIQKIHSSISHMKFKKNVMK